MSRGVSDTEEMFYGFSLEEIDSAADYVLEAALEYEASPRLPLLALCRAIVKSSSITDLDVACQLIDQLNEVDAPYLREDGASVEDEDMEVEDEKDMS